jgi:hypothetical protein
MRKLILLLAPLWLLGCDGLTYDHKDINGKPVWAVIQTVDHDGHKYVITRSSDSGGGVSIIHSAGCECLKVSK